MLSPSDVTAVLVTRGDVDLQPVLDSLVFPNVVIWDNSIESDQKTYGRVLAALRAETDAVYSQDDDIIHSTASQMLILEAYTPGKMVGCMWPEWSDGARRQGIENGYDDLVFPGSGSISDTQVWTASIDAYLEHYDRDEFFQLWSDTIIGVISPTIQLPIKFGELEWADADNRMSHLPDAVALKTEAIMRARDVRDMVAA